MLDLSPRNLDRVLYFAQYLITNVDSELQTMRIEELQKELDDGVERIESEGDAKLEELNAQLAELGEPVETDEDAEEDPDDPRRTLEARNSQDHPGNRRKNAMSSKKNSPPR